MASGTLGSSRPERRRDRSVVVSLTVSNDTVTSEDLTTVASANDIVDEHCKRLTSILDQLKAAAAPEASDDSDADTDRSDTDQHLSRGDGTDAIKSFATRHILLKARALLLTQGNKSQLVAIGRNWSQLVTGHWLLFSCSFGKRKRQDGKAHDSPGFGSRHTT
jgi:hypothetical protein